jgi:tetratricopeptide (TPR) repeat protein
VGIWDRLSRRLDELSEELLPDDLRDTVEGARELIARGEPGAAVAALDRVLAAKPGHASARYLLGVAQLKRGDAAAARAAFEQAIAARAGFTEAMVGLGEARLLAGDAAGAVPVLRDVLGRGGGRELLADAYRVLGRAYLALGEEDKGRRELRKALAEDPDDVEAAVALADNLFDDATLDADEVRPALARLAAAPGAAPATLAAFGRLELGAGRLEPAEKALRAALDGKLAPPTRVAALVALADVLERRRDGSGAHEQLLRALEVAPRDAAVHERLARLHLAVGNVDAALDALDHAAAVAGKPPWATFEAALAADRPERATRAAHALGATDDPRARGLLLLEAGEGAAARVALGAAQSSHPGRGVALALARLELAAGDAETAAARALERVRVDPNDLAAQRLHDEAARAATGIGGDLYTSARRVHTLFQRRLTAYAPEAAEVVESYDRPLLVTVMGEFSSGKSTFVNAFLGAEVAPVGITPTTATINILKYGATRGARVVYQDDEVRALAWDDVPRVLRAVDAGEARRIRHVEVLYPLEALERVNIVDTPGLNSILPEHEATARGFIAQADAIVWLFSAGQAGKASEREALDKIRAEGKRVLGVVNKIDQVGAEAPAVLAHLGGELGGLCEALVPVSARRALAARKAGDADALAASAWPGLDAALEEHFFAQARALKRAALKKRLAALLGRAHAEVLRRADAAGAIEAALGQAAAAARADAALFTRAVVPEEAKLLAERVAASYRAAARDVLELVRPRRLPFGSHSAAAADRDYLIGFLERGLAEALRPLRTRVAAELGRSARDAARAAAALGPSAEAELGSHGADAQALVEARVFDRAFAYLRGHLRGGAIDGFFTRTLPKLELVEDNVYHALVRDAPDLEPELLAPLAVQGAAALRQLGERLDGLAAQAAASRVEATALAAALAVELG